MAGRSLPRQPSITRSDSSISDCIVVRDYDRRSNMTEDTQPTSISVDFIPAAAVKEEQQNAVGGVSSPSEAEAVNQASYKPIKESIPHSTRQLRPRISLNQLLPVENSQRAIAKRRESLSSQATANSRSMSMASVIGRESISGTINLKVTGKDRETNNGDEHRRRSTRISQLEQVRKSPTDAGTLTPQTRAGKRTHDVMMNGSRSANAKLQSDSIWEVPEDMATGSSKKAKRDAKKEPTSKDTQDKQKALDKPAIPLQSEEVSEEEEEREGLVSGSRVRSKRWLVAGIYSATDPHIGRGRKGRKSASGARKAILPLPIHTGEELMNTEKDFKLPFSIFTSLLHKHHPEGWKKRNRNTFVGEALDLWKKNKQSQQSSGKCICTPESGCGDGCHNRMLYYQCDEENCAVGPEFCRNRPFKTLQDRQKMRSKFSEGVEVMETLDRGYGLRATRSYEPDEIIVEYCGEIITQAESEKRMRTVYKKSKNFYMMTYNWGLLLDATTGSIARFVNHSCDPNCRMEKWIVGNSPKVALFAGEKGIEAGEELTYNYNFDWFSGVSGQECKCGSSNCRGTLGKGTNNKEVIEEKPTRPTKPIASTKVVKPPAKAAAKSKTNPVTKVTIKSKPKSVLKPAPKLSLLKTATRSSTRCVTRSSARLPAKPYKVVKPKVVPKRPATRIRSKIVVSAKRSTTQPKSTKVQRPIRKSAQLKKAATAILKKVSTRPAKKSITPRKPPPLRNVPEPAKVYETKKVPEKQTVQLGEEVPAEPIQNDKITVCLIPERSTSAAAAPTQKTKKLTNRPNKVVKSRVIRTKTNEHVFRQTITAEPDATKPIMKTPTKTTFTRPLTAYSFETGTHRRVRKNLQMSKTALNSVSLMHPTVVKVEQQQQQQRLQHHQPQQQPAMAAALVFEVTEGVQASGVSLMNPQIDLSTQTMENSMTMLPPTLAPATTPTIISTPTPSSNNTPLAPTSALLEPIAVIS